MSFLLEMMRDMASYVESKESYFYQRITFYIYATDFGINVSNFGRKKNSTTMGSRKKSYFFLVDSALRPLAPSSGLAVKRPAKKNTL